MRETAVVVLEPLKPSKMHLSKSQLHLNFSIVLCVKLLYIFGIVCFLVSPECAPRSVHLCLHVGAVIVCTSFTGDPGQQRGES